MSTISFPSQCIGQVLLLDGYQYTPSTVEFSKAVELVAEVHLAHFRNHSLSINENAAIRKVIAMRAELAKANERL